MKTKNKQKKIYASHTKLMPLASLLAYVKNSVSANKEKTEGGYNYIKCVIMQVYCKSNKCLAQI